MRFALVFLLLLSADAASAQRPSTLSMTCAQAQALVVSRGAVVLSTGVHTFDRFVASPGYCMLGEYAEPAFAPTRDNPRCQLRYTCELGPPPWREDFRDD